MGERLMRGLLLALALVAGMAQAQVQVRDDRGRAVTLPRPPQRIVSLLPSLTETVCALDACGRLVGVDDFSNWPATVLALPHVGGVDDARIEGIVALRPDLVLLSSSARALPRLEALGVPVLGLDLKTLGDAERVLRTVGHAIGVDAAPQWRRIQSGIAAAAAGVPTSARGMRVYVEVGGGYAASASSHVGELLARLGAANVVPGELGTVPRLNPEFVVRADPQLLVVPASAMAEVRQRPGWSRIAALREGRVCVLDPQEGDVVMRPGPRLADAAGVLARCLGAPRTGRLP
ncbi:MAG: ABC transporter substrate-binding protein [Comamonadaceae bacterium]|nr:MAG: ABC transporter substrate-binding protein [Comamonadaceae bacterium]